MKVRICLTLIVVAVLSGSLRAADHNLPRRQAGEAADGGAALFPDDIGDVLPGKKLPIFELRVPEPEPDVERAKADLDQAQRKEEHWQKLVKAGVLARVEAEACVLATARARARYETARVVDQQRVLETLRERAASGQIGADEVKAAESALQTAQATAAEAEAALRRTSLLLAETNVERQRRPAHPGGRLEEPIETR